MDFQFLKRVPLFEDLNEDDLAALAQTLQQEQLPNNHVIFWMGDAGDKLYIIHQGEVAISYIDEHGKEVELAVLKAGSFFGELSLIDGLSHTATARTQKETSVLTLSQKEFYAYVDKHPQLAKKLMFVMASRLRSSTVRLRGIVNANDQIESKSSPFQRSIDGLARAFTSGTFLTFCICFILAWIIFQIFNFKWHHLGHISFLDRPPTFFLLGFMITLTSFLLTILILNSQRRQAENDRLRGEIEYQVNLKAQTEVVKLQSKVDRLLKALEKPAENDQSLDDNH